MFWDVCVSVNDMNKCCNHCFTSCVLVLYWWAWDTEEGRESGAHCVIMHSVTYCMENFLKLFSQILRNKYEQSTYIKHVARTVNICRFMGNIPKKL